MPEFFFPLPLAERVKEDELREENIGPGSLPRTSRQATSAFCSAGESGYSPDSEPLSRVTQIVRFFCPHALHGMLPISEARRPRQYARVKIARSRRDH